MQNRTNFVSNSAILPFRPFNFLLIIGIFRPFYILGLRTRFRPNFLPAKWTLASRSTHSPTSTTFLFDASALTKSKIKKNININNRHERILSSRDFSSASESSTYVRGVHSYCLFASVSPDPKNSVSFSLILRGMRLLRSTDFRIRVNFFNWWWVIHALFFRWLSKYSIFQCYQQIDFGKVTIHIEFFAGWNFKNADICSSLNSSKVIVSDLATTTSTIGIYCICFSRQ
jgi:hypothetical protein